MAEFRRTRNFIRPQTVMKTKTDDIALNILANVIRGLGPGWDRRLSEDERLLVRSCCDDAARLGIRALAVPRNRDLHVELLREKARIHERLASSSALGAAGRLADVFWEGFASTINGAVAIAFSAI
jgi:hypothetical protein